jgi:hypothetical protein
VLTYRSAGGVIVWGVEGEVNVALRLSSDKEAWLVDQLLADADVSLGDEHAGVVDGLGVVHLVHSGLQSSLQKLLCGQTEDVIQTLLILRENSISNQAAQHCITLEDALRVLLVQGQQLTGSRSNLGQSQLCSPDFSLASETIFSEQLHLLIQALLLIRAARRLRGLVIVSVETDLWPATTRPMG